MQSLTAGINIFHWKAPADESGSEEGQAVYNDKPSLTNHVTKGIDGAILFQHRHLDP